MLCSRLSATSTTRSRSTTRTASSSRRGLERSSKTLAPPRARSGTHWTRESPCPRVVQGKPARLRLAAGHPGLRRTDPQTRSCATRYGPNAHRRHRAYAPSPGDLSHLPVSRAVQPRPPACCPTPCARIRGGFGLAHGASLPAGCPPDCR